MRDTKVIQLDQSRRKARTCFVTGEEHRLAGSLQAAEVLGQRVMVSRDGAEALRRFSETGDLRELPEGPARQFLADMKGTHLARQLTMALQWFGQHPGAQLEFCPGGKGVWVRIPGKVQAVGSTVLEALEKIKARMDACEDER